MPSPSPDNALERGEQQELIGVAREAVRRGLERDRGSLALDALSPRLREPGATFVTLRRHGELLGCIGTMQPIQGMAEDVDRNAASAAFADPRLPAVTWDDFAVLSVKISVLGPLVSVDVRSHEELRQVVRPGRDGLLIAAGRRRGTFLPSVWQQVPDVDQFLEMLWQKAGLAPGSWPDRLSVSRYETFEFGDNGG